MALNPDDPNVQTVTVKPGQTVADAVGEDVSRTLRKSVGRQSFGGSNVSHDRGRPDPLGRLTSLTTVRTAARRMR